VSNSEAAILERRSIQYRDYSTDLKVEALAAWEANGKNLRETARQLQIPHQTLDYWIRDAGRLSELQTEKKGELADRLETIAYSLVESIDSHDLSIVPLQNKATTLAIAIDKMQLLRGMPTSITANTQAIESLRDKLSEAIDLARQQKALNTNDLQAQDSE